MALHLPARFSRSKTAIGDASAIQRAAIARFNDGFGLLKSIIDDHQDIPRGYWHMEEVHKEAVSEEYAAVRAQEAYVKEHFLEDRLYCAIYAGEFEPENNQIAVAKAQESVHLWEAELEKSRQYMTRMIDWAERNHAAGITEEDDRIKFYTDAAEENISLNSSKVAEAQALLSTLEVLPTIFTGSDLATYLNDLSGELEEALGSFQIAISTLKKACDYIVSDNEDDQALERVDRFGPAAEGVLDRINRARS